MKILYFYQYFGTPKGSWSTRVYEFTRRWVEQGDEVTVFTTPYDKSDIQARGFIDCRRVDGIRVIVLNVPNSNRYPFVIRLFGFLVYALAAMIYAVFARTELMICSSGPIFVGLPGLAARWLRGRKYVFEVRDLWPQGAIELGILKNPLAVKLAKWFERRCYRNASQIVALSEGMADWIRKDHGLSNVHVVPNASDNELIDGVAPRANAVPAGQHLVLYTGSLGAMNEAWQLIRLAEALKAKGADTIRIVVLGDGSDRPKLEQHARDHQLANIEFKGNVPKVEVFEWLKCASCTLLIFKAGPVMDTVSPNKLFDALAAGVPVVQSTQGWIKTLLERERCGVTVPRHDPDAMADAVIGVVTDPDRLREMRANARRVANEQFDRTLLANKMRGVLDAALKSS